MATLEDNVPLIGSDGMGYVPFVQTTKEQAQAVVDQLNSITTTWDDLIAQN